MVHRGNDREYHRSWDCGCTAIYRDTLNHTARWRPCEQHRVLSNSAEAPPTRAPDAIPKALSTAGRRSAPQFFLVDDKLQIVAASGGDAIGDIIERALKVAPSWSHDAPSVVPLTDDVFLRVIPLEGAWAHLKMVFVESLRGGLQVVARRFNLTQREVEVLQLLIAGKSKTEIALALSIAESTVGDHLKNIFRKTNSTRRTQVITKLFEPGA
jgi:DNA-binding CsgD family transcriptional regulator